MDDCFQRALRRVSVLHGIVLVVLLGAPLIATWFQSGPDKEDQLTLVDLDLPPPSGPLQVARHQEEDEGEKVPPPAQTPDKPAPPPVRDDPPPPKVKDDALAEKVAPLKTNTNRRTEIAISTTRVVRADSKKPAGKPADKGPQLSAKQIRDLLAMNIPLGDHTSLPGGGNPSLFSAYYVQVRAAMYEAWEQPGSLAGAGLVAQVKIRVQRDGAITQRSLVRGSGNQVMDQSVMKAVNGVFKLRPLPAGYDGIYKDITVDFELTGSAF